MRRPVSDSGNSNMSTSLMLTLPEVGQSVRPIASASASAPDPPTMAITSPASIFNDACSRSRLPLSSSSVRLLTTIGAAIAATAPGDSFCTLSSIMFDASNCSKTCSYFTCTS
ncbi:hypothetical protein D3C86_1808650 [compost metagenome]